MPFAGAGAGLAAPLGETEDAAGWAAADAGGYPLPHAAASGHYGWPPGPAAAAFPAVTPPLARFCGFCGMPKKAEFLFCPYCGGKAMG
mmetsp:Transcript_90352/g.281273  ORF Transcript_90352/g.281273 Transcript_90352/m.281273 type:complete len:88 (-) Transcript_90352:18-281(-)